MCGGNLHCHLHAMTAERAREGGGEGEGGRKGRSGTRCGRGKMEGES